MLDFSPEKMMFIFLIIVIVLGPEKLPEISRKIGKVMGELRKVSGGFQDEMRKAMHEVTDDTGTSADSPAKPPEVPSGSGSSSTEHTDEAPGS